MSRTMHHVPWAHWNVKVTEVVERYRLSSNGRRLIGNGLDIEEHTVGHELYDLRFFAGCKRQPQRVRHARRYDSYALTWGHHHAVSEWAKIRHRRKRAEERAFAADVVKRARAGQSVDDLLEPEGRTRHSAWRDAT